MAKKRKARDFDYAATFDQLMEDEFSEPFETEWSIFLGTFGGYVTRRVNGKKLTKKMVTFGRGVSNGISVRGQAIEEATP